MIVSSPIATSVSVPPSFNVLIVGGCAEALQLRASLVDLGAVVHVLTVPAARIIARQKRIDAAFVRFAMDELTSELCETLVGLGIPLVYFAGSRGDDAERLLGSMESEIEMTAADLGLTFAPGKRQRLKLPQG